ncbi:type 1 glutamine amidotransferase domain-containing protein [Alteromonas sediminis]|uniref:Type 1 glutamine amidotransferase domain-containing protein n=1 Tax=Alteromonas sediminis TaxID=2259342 RepID=A0A3N5ZE04_9ALTE|nr:type 1 glutamine amidotransferase domain-containing protein [Alteromonas sediminis]RPJ68478.1 type 1 glutamine amidotransferase domain-containing protein [Alteromonas sediminis]
MKVLIFVITAVFMSVSNAVAEPSKHVLMVLSSHGQQQGEERPGYEFDEFAKAYLVFKQHGITVDIASPKGGVLVADEYDPKKPFNAQVIADDHAMAKLNSSLPLHTLSAAHYDGVFVVGGKGAMFDFPNNKALQTLITDIYQQQGSVAAVCHGPAALVNVRLNDGSYLIANKAINGFTNEEERMFGKKWMKEFDFLLEDKLIERGGKFQSSGFMLAHVAVDGRLITGQNPSSTVGVALELVKSLGVEVQPVEQYTDDKTMGLVAKLLNGEYKAIQPLITHAEAYNIKLVGMYGYYYMMKSDTAQDYRNALMLMNVAKEAINSPNLEMQIAKAHQALGDSQSAALVLHEILADQPAFKAASDMLVTLTQ